MKVKYYVVTSSMATQILKISSEIQELGFIVGIIIYPRQISILLKIRLEIYKI